ncbi:MAG: GNAT family N-acetyltransferase, partial [Tepidisphaeraceae bacterium]
TSCLPGAALAVSGRGGAEGMQLSEKLSYLGVVLPNVNLMPQHRQGRARPRRFASTGGMTAHWSHAWPTEPELLDSWLELSQTHPAGTAFHTPAWQQALARPYLRVRRHRLLIVRHGSRVDGVFPLQVNAGGVLETPGSMISDYLEPLIRPELSYPVWDSCIRALSETPGVAVKRVVFHNVRPEYADTDAIGRACLQAGFSMTISESARVSRVPLPASWDQYLRRLSRHDRKEIRRKLRNSVSRAGAELRAVSSEPEISAALETVFGFMRKSGGVKGIKAQWTYRPMFKRASAGLVQSGRLEVLLLRLKGRDAAGLISLPTAAGPLLWASGFDQTQSSWSPGIVLFAMAIERAISRGEQWLDLLRCQQRYKSEFGAVDSPICRITLTRR